MNKINLTLMGKGGAGKTLTSWIQAQYFQQQGRPLYCADTDPTNSSFSHFKALNVEHIRLLDESMVVNPSKFDDLIERLLDHDGVSVVDNGASSFLPMISYATQNHVFELLTQAGHEVIIHAPIIGGPAMLDTLTGFQAILHACKVKVVIWQNEYFGPVQLGDVSLRDIPVIKKNLDRILGIVRVRARDPMTFGADIRKAMEMNLTLEEADKSPAFRIMQRQRLRMVQRDLFDQLTEIGL